MQKPLRKVTVAVGTWAMLACQSLMAVDFFQDDFDPTYLFADYINHVGYTGTLDTRWNQDISALNVEPNLPAGEGIMDVFPPLTTGSPGSIIVNNGLVDGWGYALSLQEAYNHLETPIDTDGQFAIESRVRINSGQDVGAHTLAIYWDPTSYVYLQWGWLQPLRRRVSDPINAYNEEVRAAPTGLGGGIFTTLRIEFWEDSIKFFAMQDGDPNLAHVPAFDIPRNADWKQTPALLIVGKGKQTPDETNPDFDNDPAEVFNPDPMIVDYITYEGLCGADGTVYLDGDVTRDCYVDVAGDFLELAGDQWLSCTDGANPACDKKIEAFLENFGQGEGPDASRRLHPRWFEDNSPRNAPGVVIHTASVGTPGVPTGSEFELANGWGAHSGNGPIASGNRQVAYHHLETPFDTTGDFYVRTRLNGRGHNAGGVRTAVYWDRDKFVDLAGLSHIPPRREVFDPVAGFSKTADLAGVTGAEDYYNMKIEFTGVAGDPNSWIRFSISRRNAGGPFGGETPVYVPEWDLPRESWMTGPALFIVGKGTGDPAFGLGPAGSRVTNPDFDNDQNPGPGNQIGCIITRADYQPAFVPRPHFCGDSGTRYRSADVNRDCYVNLKDFAKVAEQLAWCSDPGNSACDIYWQ